ncbi:sugar kinase, partial [Burkholderia ubonensis]
AGLVAGMPIDAALRRANAAGAIAVTRRGPMEGNSDAAEIERFLTERGVACPA